MAKMISVRLDIPASVAAAAGLSPGAVPAKLASMLKDASFGKGMDAARLLYAAAKSLRESPVRRVEGKPVYVP